MNAYTLKLAYIDEWLFSNGWEYVRNGWHPPKDMAYAMRFTSPNWKDVTYKRSDAVRLQVLLDESLEKAIDDGILDNE